MGFTEQNIEIKVPILLYKNKLQFFKISILNLKSGTGQITGLNNSCKVFVKIFQFHFVDESKVYPVFNSRPIIYDRYIIL